jgi:hypothetical protein
LILLREKNITFITLKKEKMFSIILTFPHINIASSFDSSKNSATAAGLAKTRLVLISNTKIFFLEKTALGQGQELNS